jgi:hypothetical protein
MSVIYNFVKLELQAVKYVLNSINTYIRGSKYNN